MSLTGAPPPLPPTLATPIAAGEAGVPAIIGILDARGPDRLASSVTDVLHAASGPGNIITGKVAELRPDGTVFLTTPSGAELSFRHPPEVPLELGSTITLRLVATVPVAQAVLLAVDGRSVAGLLARGAAARQAGSAEPAAGLPAAAAGSQAVARGAGPADFGIAISADLVATLGREGVVENETTGLTGRALEPAVSGAEDGSAIGIPVVATLVRAAAARPGVAVPALGTRYLLSVAAVAAPAEPTVSSEPARPDAAAARPTPTPTAAGAAAALRLPPTPPGPAELVGFTPQTALLAGRVTAARSAGEVLVETGLGTLALPVDDRSVAIGSAVHLRVTAVARPLAAASGIADPVTLSGPAGAVPPANPPPSEVPQTALQEALGALAALEPSLAKTAAATLVLQPGAQLAALIFGFLAGIQAGTPKRWSESPARAALDALGRSDVRETLDTDADPIGSQMMPAAPGDWKVTVLPYLGVDSLSPARLYQRPTEAKVEEDGSPAGAPGQRFVVEIELRHLGPLQFDGLVRERRFDLALRTGQPLDPALQGEIGQIFRETAGISGYAGDLVFGRLARFPLLPITTSSGIHEIKA